MVILWVVRAGYPDRGYLVGCPVRLSETENSMVETETETERQRSPEGVIQTWLIRLVVRAGYSDEGYPGGLSGRGLSGSRNPKSVGGPPATSFRRRLPEEVTLSGA